MSINFEFLNDISDNKHSETLKRLYKRCSNVEQFVYTDKDLSISESRVACELIAQLFYTKKIGKCDNKTLAQILKEQKFETAINRIQPKNRENFICYHMNEIRETSNPAHHGAIIENPQTTALINLKNLYYIVVDILLDLQFLDAKFVPKYVEPPAENDNPKADEQRKEDKQEIDILSNLKNISVVAEVFQYDSKSRKIR